MAAQGFVDPQRRLIFGLETFYFQLYELVAEDSWREASLDGLVMYKIVCTPVGAATLFPYPLASEFEFDTGTLRFYGRLHLTFCRADDTLLYSMSELKCEGV